MATRLDHPGEGGGTTSHGDEIGVLRLAASIMPDGSLKQTEFLLAADLLELHDRTGISLDDWASARRFVETLVEGPILENGV